MLRPVVWLAIVVTALSVPRDASAQSFSFCHSPTSGSCFNFAGFGGGSGGSSWGSWGSGWSSAYGSLQSWINSIIQQVVEHYDLEDLLDDWYHDPRPSPNPPVSVPEPTSLLLIGTGILGLGARWRRREQVG